LFANTPIRIKSKGLMTNPTIELMHQHASIRQYKSDAIPLELIETIVTAGQRAATSSNLQMYSVVLTTDTDDRRRLQAYCGDQAHISQAPVFLTWCADLSRLDRICAARGYTHQSGHVENFLLAAVDAVIAAQNTALAAESLGLGFCYIGAIRNNPRKVIQLLELPRLVFPVVGMTVGWPVKPATIRPRLPLDVVLHKDRYNPENESQRMAQYDQEMIDTGIYRGRQVGTMDILPATGYGWQEHSARRVSNIVRPHLRQVLQESGFELK
jgi:FMN reductase (NADPH)